MLAITGVATRGPPKIRARVWGSIKSGGGEALFAQRKSMEPVRAFIRETLQTDRYGGRVIMRDENTLILYDTPGWGDRQAHMVRAKFPECEVSCLAHAQSMSGFIVVIRRHAHPRASLWASLFILALAGVAYTAIVLHRGLLEEGL